MKKKFIDPLIKRKKLLSKKVQFDENEIKVVSIDELTKESDYITLHVPINEATRNLFDIKRLKQLDFNIYIDSNLTEKSSMIILQNAKSFSKIVANRGPWAFYNAFL